MKKILLFACLLLISNCIAYTQIIQDFPEIDTEKIFLFDVKIQVQPDATIQVKEHIVLNATGNKIRRGIYRNIPVSLTEQVRPLSLTMDGNPHPFSTEKKNRYLRINFGDNNYITKGAHAYTFTYVYGGAIDFLKNYDELYWNVTGNEWDFPIEKARVHITFPPNVNVRKEGISLYTGHTLEKQKNAQQSDSLTFETTKPLQPKEGFTISVPFDKGAIQKPPFWQRFHNLFSFPFIFFEGLFILLLGYYVLTWFAVGKDPVSLAIAQYDPPQGLSPAFMYYLLNRTIDPKLLACAILNLAMKGYIDVETKNPFSANSQQGSAGKKPGFLSFLFSQTQLIRTDKQADNLFPEEQKSLDILFSTSNTCFLDARNSAQFELLKNFIKTSFKADAKPYILSNTLYLFPAFVIVLLLGTVPFILLKNMSFLFLNLHFSIFFLFFMLAVYNIRTKIIVGLCLTLFYTIFWLGDAPSIDTSLYQLMFLASMWGLTFYHSLICNVTPLGKELFKHIAGFKKYMKTAETYRVTASNPVESERIFCNYLPFAFALGLENKWIENFSRILSKTTVEKCTASAGGTDFISRGLSNSISSAMPSKGSNGGSSSGGGSFGGGHSGGGHGGGGGGGR